MRLLSTANATPDKTFAVAFILVRCLIWEVEQPHLERYAVALQISLHWHAFLIYSQFSFHQPSYTSKCGMYGRFSLDSAVMHHQNE